jgi:signal transduction histidine kinase
VAPTPRAFRLALALGFGGVALAVTTLFSLLVLQIAPVELVARMAAFGVGIAGAAAATGWVLGGRVVPHRDPGLEQIKDNFISTVSHELRTPLTSINGSLALLTAGLLEKEPERAERMLKIAAANADRLARLVNDVLDVERFTSGGASLEMAACSPLQVVQDAVCDVRERAVQRVVSVHVACEVEESLSLHADAERLQQVLRNLLDNAIKFSPSGSEVTVSVHSTAKDVAFFVRDQGAGIAAADLPRIFDRFHQIDMSDARRAGGAGLGLAISKSIVEAHGGLIRAESPGLGQGATVSVVIPR